MTDQMTIFTKQIIDHTVVDCVSQEFNEIAMLLQSKKINSAINCHLHQAFSETKK